MKTVKIALLIAAMTSGNVIAQEVSKKDWMTSMQTLLPGHFCESSQYFRQCFDVSEAQCTETAASTTKACLTTFEPQMPDTLYQPSGWYKLGAEGGCLCWEFL